MEVGAATEGKWSGCSEWRLVQLQQVSGAGQRVKVNAASEAVQRGQLVKQVQQSHQTQLVQRG